MMILLVVLVTTLFGSGSCDFKCLCNYHVELNVLGQYHQQTLGYLYEFDCKPVVDDTDTIWVAVAYEHQLGYVQKDEQVQIQTCPGDPSPDDILLTTVGLTSATESAQTTRTQMLSSTLSLATSEAPTPTSSTTRIPTTTTHISATTTSATKQTTQPTTLKTTKTTELPTPPSTTEKTTITATTTPKSTTASTTEKTTITATTTPKSTTASTTEKITTTTTITPKPTTSSTTEKTTITTTTTPKPTTTSTTEKTSTATTTTPTTTHRPTMISTTTLSSTTSTTPPPTTQSTSTVKMATSTPTTIPAVTHNELSHVNVCPQLVQEYAKDDNSILTTYGHNCYEIVQYVATWTHAEHDCRQKGGHLLHIGSQAEQTFIYNVLQKSNFHHSVWTGLHDQNQESHFEWVSGDSVTYTDFYWHGVFDFQFHGLEDCVVMSSTHQGQWDDRDCDNEFNYYICQYPTVDSSTIHITTPDPSQISEGNIHLCSSTAQNDATSFHGVLGQYDRSCYELLPVQYVAWNHGEAHCQKHGGHLAHISNAQEQDFIQRFMTANFPNHAVWIGLHDINIEGHYEWTSGNAVQYTNWLPGHTSNFVSHHQEDCIAFIPYRNGQWDDIPCGGQGIFGGDTGESHPVLCQYKISASVVPVGK